MADKNTVSVQDATVVGKLVGRDDNSTNFITSYERSMYLEKLYEEFQKEKETCPELKEMCADLDYLNSQVENDKVIGLEEKLKSGGRERILDYATRMKEKFHKKLMLTSQYSNAAQDVNVYILSKVQRGFMMDVYTLICNNESGEKIDAMIEEKIIKPVKAELGINLFKYDEGDIMGMIFFLTGNCHIKWTK